MSAHKIVVYGLSTEGYAFASRMAIAGVEVHIIDRFSPSAILLTAEIARTYPDVASIMEDEPLLAMKPMAMAISDAQYLFFAPVVRKSLPDIKTEINSKFKEVVAGLKKNSSVVFMLPTGFGGNSENISLLEHVTGLVVGKSVSYFYYPLRSSDRQSAVVGSFNGAEDDALSALLADASGPKKFVSLTSAEYFHAIDVVSRFTGLSSMLEVCKYAKDGNTKSSMESELPDLFLDDIADEITDLLLLKSSFEKSDNLLYLINGSLRGIEYYIKRIVDEIRSYLKNNEIRSSRVRVVLSWTVDSHAMRGDKIDMRQQLQTKIRDYVSDVEILDDSDAQLFHNGKITIFLACSKSDLDHVLEIDSSPIMVKAGLLCDLTS